MRARCAAEWSLGVAAALSLLGCAASGTAPAGAPAGLSPASRAVAGPVPDYAPLAGVATDRALAATAPALVDGLTRLLGPRHLRVDLAAAALENPDEAACDDPAADGERVVRL